MLSILHPPGYLPERRYIYDLLIHQFLGQRYVLDVYDGTEVRITLQGDPQGRALIMPDTLFQTAPEQWLTAASLPRQPLQWREIPGYDEHLRSYRIPVIYGQDTIGPQLYQETPEGLLSGLDLFGSAFFMLTRYEEIVKPERDKFDRFPASASLAFQEGFLERPVVNEYLEGLWQMLTRLWPTLERPARTYRVLLSHDVDHPLSGPGKSWALTVRSILADLVLRRDATLAARRLRSYVWQQRGHFDGDPYDTFDFIMDLSEQYDRSSAFYFITDHSAGAIDGYYSMEDTWIRALLRRIHQRGHEIGLHPSFNTYRDVAQIQLEMQRLLQVTAKEGICQQEWGGRQHYLRWNNPTTWQNWAEAGLSYDSSLSFSEWVGFRCGICYEFPIFQLQTRQALTLRERPLIVMELTLFEYMRLSWEASLRKIIDLSAICKSFKGDFTLLWHNNGLISKRQQEQYREMCASL